MTKSEHRVAVQHAIRKIATAPLVDRPYRHLLIDGIWPVDYYNAMRAHFPTKDEMSHPKRARDYHEIWEGDLVPDPGMEHHADGSRLLDKTATHSTFGFWEGFRAAAFGTDGRPGALGSAMLARFLTEGLLAEKYGFLRHGWYEVGRVAIDELGAGLGPHLDRTDKLVSAVFYLAPYDVPDEEAEGSGTILLAPKDGVHVEPGSAHRGYDDFDVVTTAQYRPNRLICWPVTPDSWHAYHQRADINRRTVKFFVQADMDADAVQAEIASTHGVAESWRETTGAP